MELNSFRVSGEAFVRAENLGAIARRNRQGIARSNEGSAGQAFDHFRADGWLAAHLIAHGFNFFDSGFQVRTQTQDRFQHINDKAESQQNQNCSDNESQSLPPGLFGCVGVFRAVVERGFVSSADA